MTEPEHPPSRALGVLDVLMASYAGAMWPIALVTLLTVLSWMDPSSGRYYLLGVGGQSGTHVAMTVLLATWAVVHVILPIPMLASALGIRYRRTWGRKLGILVGAMLLPMVPVGTLVGMLVMGVLSHPGNAMAFENGAD